MRTYQIAFLTGDGVGPVMARAGQELLERLGRAHGFQIRPALLPFGKGAYEACGTPLPPEAAEGIQASDAALCAAVDAHGIPGPTPVGMLRKSLDLFADVRPIRARPGRWALRPDLDLVVVREVTQGFLSDRNLYQGGGEWMSDADTAFSLRVISYAASRRIADYAFDYARRSGRKKVTALHKASIFKLTCGTFLRACRDTAAEWPDIAYAEEVVDDAANGLISRSGDYDVLLTTNLFGDILSDEAAALVSSLAPSVNVGPRARVYLPVCHSPAYQALEADRFDPMPALLCLHMLLADLGEADAAAQLDGALDQVLTGEYPTASALLADLGARLGGGSPP